LKNKRAISDIVAEIMMILVTLAIGFVLIAYLSSSAGSFVSLVNSNSNKEQLNLQQYIVPMGSYVNKSNLYIIFNTGPMGEEVYNVYINSTLINTCQVSYKNNWYSLPANLPSNAVAVIKCSNIKNSPLLVTISYSGGEVEIEANPS
jgi:FlaG/FlaF family flagellin (archaellin)